MLITKSIRIPTEEHVHYTNLLSNNLPDYNYALWSVLAKYPLEIEIPQYGILYQVYNTPFGICMEFQLINTLNKQEVDASDICFSLSDKWTFELLNDTYVLQVEQCDSMTI